MLPSLSPLSEDGGGTAPSALPVPPPLRFRPVAGRPFDIKRRQASSSPSNTTVARANGLRFEAQVQDRLKSLWGSRYFVSPMLTFHDDNNLQSYRSVIPDGIRMEQSQDRIFIIEIKIQHMPEAWWQLERLYRPIVEAWCPGVNVYSIEIVKTFDPQMPFNCPITMIDDLEAWCQRPRPEFGVYVWK